MIVEALPRLTVAVSSQSPGRGRGLSIVEDCEGTDGCDRCLRDCGHVSGCAEMCGTTHKTVKRIVEAHQAEQAGELGAERGGRGHNYDAVAGLVAGRWAKTQGRISAKRLLPAARAAGYPGSPRNSAAGR